MKKRIKQLEKCLRDVRRMVVDHQEFICRNTPYNLYALQVLSNIERRINRTCKS
jgi:hypothetical protein